MNGMLMRKIVQSAWFWLFCLPLLAANALAASGDAFFDTSLGDFAAEIRTAQAKGKAGVLLMIEAEGCPYCRRMREKVLSQPAVQQYFRAHFNSFSVDFMGSVPVTDFTGKEVTEKNFARSQRVRGTPTFLFVGPDGKEMARYTGATRDADEFMALGRFVVDGHWQKMTFEQFRSKP
jgi:thioredoxin-related protein